MKFFLHSFTVIILVLSQLSDSFARESQCCHSTTQLDEMSMTYLRTWDDSKLSMGDGIKKYVESVSNLANECESTSKDIDAVKENALLLIDQVYRISDGCGQSLRQLKMMALQIERLDEKKKSDTTCNALGKSIEVIEDAAAKIQKCQDTFNDTVNSAVSRSTEEINKIDCENIDDEVFPNFAKLNSQISTTGNAYEKCKATVLGRANDKLNALLNQASQNRSNFNLLHLLRLL